MSKNRIEAFFGDDSCSELEDEINRYCSRHNYNPISISVAWTGSRYTAFVVVEEEGKSED